MKRCTLLIIALTLSACAHQSVTWQRTANAAEHAASHASVWGPLAGAALFTVGNFDISSTRELSDDTPVFGSQSNASRASDNLHKLLVWTALGSAVTAPVTDEEHALTERGDHLIVTYGGLEMTSLLTQRIKQGVQRERPNGDGLGSFPSGHASQSFAAATFASRNFHRRWGDSTTTQWTDAGLYTAASLTAYARVEGNFHHPVDVMVGASLGNFISRFLDELLLTDKSDVAVSAYADGNYFSFSIEKYF